MRLHLAPCTPFYHFIRTKTRTLGISVACASTMVRWDGHEIGVLSTLAGCAGIAHGSMPKGWVKSFIHRQPIAAMSVFLFGVGVLLPVTVVPVRRALGMPTNQYDAEYPGVKYPKYESIKY